MKSGKRLLSALLVLALLLLPAAMAEQDAAEAFFLTPEAGAEESLSLESEQRARKSRSPSRRRRRVRKSRSPSRRRGSRAV